jgi:6-phosphogluconolactonase
MAEKSFIFPETGALAQALAAHVLQIAADAVAARQRFTLALSGGSALTLLAEGLHSIAPSPSTDWSAWHIYWADERCVPKTASDSNFAAAQQIWLSHTPIPPDQIHSIDDTRSPAAAAEAYARELATGLLPSKGEVPQFDLILLGMGEDGHTASLFPGHSAIEEVDRWVVAVDDSPKPPSSRITLTLPVINRARQVAIVATGGGKAAVLARVRKGTTPFLPVQRVHPYAGDLRWFLDSSAAGLPPEDPDMKQGAPYVE